MALRKPTPLDFLIAKTTNAIENVTTGESGKTETMKPDKNELDVDFIGGQGALTKDEETAIREFIKAEKNVVKNHKQK